MKKIIECSVPEFMESLRALMAKDMSSNKRLDSILTLLCESLYMPTAVLYMMRPGDVLERSKMLGQSVALPEFIRLGEGVIGQVALDKKMILDYTKSTKYKTVLAVPVVRGNEVLAVLALLSRRMTVLKQDVVEAVQNVSMVLAEFLMDADANKNHSSLMQNVSVSKVYEGTGMVNGFAIGEVLLHRRVEMDGPLLAKHPDNEIKRLNMAFSRVQNAIRRRLDRVAVSSDEKELFESYLLFLNDAEWKAKIIAAITTGLSAQAALQKIGDEMLEKMRSISDGYIRERARDFQGLTIRLMSALVRKKHKKKLSSPKILVADTLGAAELLDYDLRYIKGIIVEDGSRTSHIVIVARAYRIPLLGGVQMATRVFEDTSLIALDTTVGKVYVRPTDEILDELKERQKQWKRTQAIQNRGRDKPCVTRDKVPVSLMLNLGVSGAWDKLPMADGIGLYRTELLFMTAKNLPDLQTQTDAYKRALVLAKNKPVVFRTLDIGSDKVLPYFESQNEENPAMGWRSIRMVLDRRALLRTQLRALLRATAGKTLYVMFPMVTEVAEFVEAKRTLQVELENARSKKEKLPVDIKVGTMLEVPALLFQLDYLLPLVDFISIGTNDLAQFMFAADRTNPQIAKRYDVLSPAFLKTLKHIVDYCNKYHVKCSVCGEMAASPLEAVALLGIGVRTLSMSPDAVPAVKTAIRTLSLKKFRVYLMSQLNSCQPSLRAMLFSYLRDHHVQIGGNL